MVNTEIRFIILFAAKDGEALYNQQKQDWELTVAQTEGHGMCDSCSFFMGVTFLSSVQMENNPILQRQSGITCRVWVRICFYFSLGQLFV